MDFTTPWKKLEKCEKRLIIQTDRGWLQGMFADGHGVFTDSVETARKWKRADTSTLIQYIKDARPNFRITDVVVVTTTVEAASMPISGFLDLVNTGMINLLS